MAKFLYQEAARAFVTGEFDWVTDTIKVLFVMSNTTAASENDGINFIDDITTLDEFDGASYARTDLANRTSTEQHVAQAGPTTAIIKMDGDNFTTAAWGASGTGRKMSGAIVYKHVTTDADSVPICYFDLPREIASGTVQATWHSDGVIQVETG